MKSELQPFGQDRPGMQDQTLASVPTEHKTSVSVPRGELGGAIQTAPPPVERVVDPLIELRKKLTEAIEEEKYELAAQLRDEIRELQSTRGPSSSESGATVNP